MCKKYVGHVSFLILTIIWITTHFKGHHVESWLQKQLETCGARRVFRHRWSFGQWQKLIGSFGATTLGDLSRWGMLGEGWRLTWIQWMNFMQSPKRLLRTGSLHLKSAFAGFSRVWKGFAGNTVTPQQTTKNLQNTSHSLATHFHKCCLRAVFTTKNFVQHLSYSLTLNASVIFCLMFPSQNFVAPLLSHFPNTFQQNSIQFIKPPPKSCTRLQKAANRGIWKK